MSTYGEDHEDRIDPVDVAMPPDQREGMGAVAWGVAAVVIAGLLWLAAGCAPIPQDPGAGPTLPQPPVAVRTGTTSRAVVAGLTAVDPRAYGGWSGACPGCDVDASTWALLCMEQGIETWLLLNQEATKAGLLAAARRAWTGLKADDLLILFISGHGGQDTDTDGDEEDGLDETLCLWDGQLSDDVLGRLWQEAPAGLRVFFITDTCNSGTNFKRWPRSLVAAMPRRYSGQLIHFGGCPDGESSYGSPQGGTWTTALIDAWDPEQSYSQWFDRAAKRMPRNQRPYYAEYGEVREEFRNGRVMR